MCKKKVFVVTIVFIFVVETRLLLKHDNKGIVSLALFCTVYIILSISVLTTVAGSYGLCLKPGPAQ